MGKIPQIVSQTGWPSPTGERRPSVARWVPVASRDRAVLSWSITVASSAWHRSLHRHAAAAGCPQLSGGDMDLLLYLDQMMLQIHESIGHPLELDRIFGDERTMPTSLTLAEPAATNMVPSCSTSPLTPASMPSWHPTATTITAPRPRKPSSSRTAFSSCRWAERSPRNVPALVGWPTPVPARGTVRQWTAWPISMSSPAPRASTSSSARSRGADEDQQLVVHR